jgi:hypothetical protein
MNLYRNGLLIETHIMSEDLFSDITDTLFENKAQYITKPVS